mmetsp:Transcript_17496/g.44832  ORF Transcript_17496/g.44832 Transcript_17496/m.44832 type:complete len:214 (-) Transcript_17496:224-865(-)
MSTTFSLLLARLRAHPSAQRHRAARSHPASKAPRTPRAHRSTAPQRSSPSGAARASRERPRCRPRSRRRAPARHRARLVGWGAASAVHRTRCSSSRSAGSSCHSLTSWAVRWRGARCRRGQRQRRDRSRTRLGATARSRTAADPARTRQAEGLGTRRASCAVPEHGPCTPRPTFPSSTRPSCPRASCSRHGRPRRVSPAAELRAMRPRHTGAR